MKRMILSLLACFTLGVLAGAAALSMFLGHEIERLTYRTRIQQEELAKANRELNGLRASLKARRKRCIRGFDVKTVLTGELTEIEKRSIRIELEKEIEKRLNPLKDCELATLDYWLIPGMLNERSVTVDGREFELHVETVVVSETLGVLVRAKPKEKVPLPAPL
ncbi:MAG TPA: hypothetical protein EYP63_02440 [Desulfotomaculum sp.]|nr:hypothetical protein [Desulfotomaculum sp.]